MRYKQDPYEHIPIPGIQDHNYYSIGEYLAAIGRTDITQAEANEYRARAVRIGMVVPIFPGWVLKKVAHSTTR